MMHRSVGLSSDARSNFLSFIRSLKLNSAAPSQISNQNLGGCRSDLTCNSRSIFAARYAPVDFSNSMSISNGSSELGF